RPHGRCNCAVRIREASRIAAFVQVNVIQVPGVVRAGESAVVSKAKPEVFPEELFATNLNSGLIKLIAREIRYGINGKDSNPSAIRTEELHPEKVTFIRGFAVAL